MRLIAVLALLMSASWSAAAQEQARYQIVAGTMNRTHCHGQVTQEETVFRLDTKTGETWVAISLVVSDGKGNLRQVRQWQQFEMDFALPADYCKPKGH